MRKDPKEENVPPSRGPWSQDALMNYTGIQNAINVGNAGPNINSLYKIVTPFQITCITCTGPGENDTINIETLAGDRAVSYKQPSTLHHAQYRARNYHFHDYFEVFVVLEGTIRQMIEGKEYLYPTGSCCLINRSLIHLEDYTEPAKVFFIGFSVDLIRRLFASTENAAFPQEKEILDGAVYRFVINDLEAPGTKAYLDFMPTYGNASKIQALCQAILDTTQTPTFGATYRLYGMLALLLANLSDETQFHCTEVQLSHDSDTLILARVRHILEERHGRVSRSELSDQLNYSGDYINRIVKKYTGQSLFDYAMTFCLKQAAYELTHTEASVSEIAQHLQFTNRTHFYRLFEKMYGVTPKEYRNQKRKAAAIQVEKGNPAEKG